jgi:hypothetical protein
MSASAGKEVLSLFSRNKKTGSARRVGTLPWIIKFKATGLIAPYSFFRKCKNETSKTSTLFLLKFFMELLEVGYLLI